MTNVVDHLIVSLKAGKNINFLVFKISFAESKPQKNTFTLHCRVSFKQRVILFSYHELHFTLHFNVLCHTIHSSCTVSFSQADLFKHTSLAISSPFPGFTCTGLCARQWICIKAERELAIRISDSPTRCKIDSRSRYQRVQTEARFLYLFSLITSWELNLINNVATSEFLNLIRIYIVI